MYFSFSFFFTFEANAPSRVLPRRSPMSIIERFNIRMSEGPFKRAGVEFLITRIATSPLRITWVTILYFDLYSIFSIFFIRTSTLEIHDKKEKIISVPDGNILSLNVNLIFSRLKYSSINFVNLNLINSINCSFL